jgi:glucose uptake protein
LILPATYSTAVLLLIVSCPLLALWPLLFRQGRERWRYQFFSLDFAIGAAVTGILAAFTLGWFGPDATFSDRMLIAGGLASASALASGLLFGLGNMFLLAAIALRPLSQLVLPAGALSLLIAAVFTFNSANATALSIALMLLLLTVRLALQRDKKHTGPATVKERAREETRQRRGTTLAIAAGVLFGLACALLERINDPEYGPGPYTVVLLMSIGIFCATAFSSIFLTKIAIEGPPISMTLYIRSSKSLHLPGILGGVLWAAGALCALAARSIAGEQSPAFARTFIPALAVLLSSIGGMLLARDPGKASTRRWLAGSALSFLAAVAVLSFAWTLHNPS